MTSINADWMLPRCDEQQPKSTLYHCGAGHSVITTGPATHQSTQCPAWWQRALVRTMSWLGQVTTSCLLAAPASPSPTSTSYTANTQSAQCRELTSCVNNPLPTQPNPRPSPVFLGLAGTTEWWWRVVLKKVRCPSFD